MKTCPLCLNRVEKLHKRSHLLPEWMYKDVYDERHKLVNVDFKNEYVKKEQKGIHDEIICPTCESESQQYDRYASLILTKRSPTSIEYSSITRIQNERVHNGELCKYSHWKNINFHKFQKFVYICILRTHFSNSKNGKPLLIEKHFQKIRNLYLSNQSNDDKSYPIITLNYLNNNGFEDIVLLPFANKKYGHFTIELAGCGYNFEVYVSSHRNPKFVNSLRLMENGSMYIIHDYMENTGTFRNTKTGVVNIADKFPNFKI